MVLNVICVWLFDFSRGGVAPPPCQLLAARDIAWQLQKSWGKRLHQTSTGLMHVDGNGAWFADERNGYLSVACRVTSVHREVGQASGQSASNGQAEGYGGRHRAGTVIDDGNMTMLMLSLIHI